ncbi:hypothetical protein M501DRAFT_937620 [Patellaria atrata CBS 101060]|uniref:Copper acquisition factor BIM1-like domain-containing protein n=1 Tax=Patellaria atrata CBS 101060 TaxID=1346257 RepID=A0A9P4S7W3_9PEZI|nr:hypothetical protein M501DRAFT_806614 [Patellaria atrata CBS 101060]KAF2837559.1 hypothetical protein M501DRAFT_937620 [Patellaria atrata CBS 101060]
MLSTTSLPLLSLLTLTSAHFRVDYPYWRGDSFEEPASQWIWPCANVNQTESANNRTAWPLTGGSISLEVHHPWALTYVNLGIGNEVTSFETSLLTGFNQTGNGTFCLRELGGMSLADLGIEEGTNATLQFIQASGSGSALYNCADITFTADAELLSTDMCANTTGVAGVPLMNADATHMDHDEPTPTESAAEETSTGAAADLRVSGAGAGVVGAVVGFAALLAL